MAEIGDLGFIFSSGDPEEARKRQERLAMGVDELTRSVLRMIEEMPVDHLMTIRVLFHEGMTADVGEYLCGLINGNMQWARKLCVQCGESSHETEAAPCMRSMLRRT
jgi:hypothetical protein